MQDDADVVNSLPPTLTSPTTLEMDFTFSAQQAGLGFWVI